MRLLRLKRKRFFPFRLAPHSLTSQPFPVMNQTTVSLPTVAIARLTAAVASLSGVRFAGVTYRSKESGELARHTLILGASYENTVKTSIGELVAMGGADLAVEMQATKTLQKAIALTAKGTPERKAANNALAIYQDVIGPARAAMSELCISLYQTLASGAEGQENPAYTKAGLYESICAGLKVSRADGSFELVGLSHSKTVLQAGVYPVVNSSAKTIAKDMLRRSLPIGKFRTLALDVGHLDSVRIGGAEVDVQDLLNTA